MCTDPVFTNLEPVDGDRAVLLRVTVTAGRAELVADALFGHGATSVEERPGELVAGFGNRGAAASALTALSALERLEALVEVPDDTWFDGWRAYARAQPVGRRLVVRPAWLPCTPSPGEVVIDIDPGRAFGSGAHPSTRMVLEVLEAALDGGAAEGGMSVLDVGSGSGVLTVAAGLLGAARLVAVDIDPIAREVTRANVERGGVSAEVLAALPEERFDLVVANIGARALIELAEDLARRARRLVLAGFFTEQAEAVRAAYPAAVAGKMTSEDGWACLDLRFD